MRLVSEEEARRIAVCAQLLDGSATTVLDTVRRLGYDERFIRTWDFYLAYCEAAFRTRSLRDVQLVLSR